MKRPDREAVLEVIREFAAEHFPDADPARIESCTASELIRQSLELVEFVLQLEETLGVEVNVNQLGETLVTSTFGELADRIAAGG